MWGGVVGWARVIGWVVSAVGASVQWQHATGVGHGNTLPCHRVCTHVKLYSVNRTYWIPYTVYVLGGGVSCVSLCSGDDVRIVCLCSYVCSKKNAMCLRRHAHGTHSHTSRIKRVFSFRKNPKIKKKRGILCARVSPAPRPAGGRGASHVHHSTFKRVNVTIHDTNGTVYGFLSLSSPWGRRVKRAKVR